MELQALRSELHSHSTAEISYKTGLSIATVLNIKAGRNTNPTTKTVKAFVDYLEMKKNEA